MTDLSMSAGPAGPDCSAWRRVLDSVSPVRGPIVPDALRVRGCHSPSASAGSVRFMLLALAFGFLSIAASAAQSFELGPQLAISAPTGDGGEAMDAGINAGVTATFMKNSTAGIGVDLGYHHWPGSSEANAAYDALLSRLSGTPISGSKGTFSAFMATGHVKVIPPLSGRVAPWVQVGAGLYRVNGNVKVPEDQLRAAGWQVVKQSSGDIFYEFGYMGGVGLDFKTNTSMKFGLDASYHYLQSRGDLRVNLTMFTIGAHVLFGSR